MNLAEYTRNLIMEDESKYHKNKKGSEKDYVPWERMEAINPVVYVSSRLIVVVQQWDKILVIYLKYFQKTGLAIRMDLQG